MFSRYQENIKLQDLNDKNLNIFNQLVKERQKYIIEQIRPYSDITKVIFIGMTGCGKSCLSCSLSNKELLVKGKGAIMHLEGEGIGVGLKSFTTIPMFESDINRRSIFIDCPGFEDVKGYVQEILNAFSIDNIFDKYPNHENKFKIILVISQDEFYSNKGSKMVSSFLRLEQMFPIGEKLRRNIGLVITKGPLEYEGCDYIDELDETIRNTENPPDHLVRICQFFKSNPNHVFAFPKPSRMDKDKQYVFQDRDKLLNFLHNDLLINPDHKLILSPEAILKLKLIREDHSKKLSNSIQNLCQKIYNQFSSESKSAELQKWYRLISDLFEANIKKAEQLKDFLKNNFPKSEQYQNDLKEIAEYEMFDEFIDKILYSAVDTSCLNEVIHNWCLRAINQLHLSIINAIDSENTKENLAAQETLRIESEKKIEEFKNIIRQKEEESIRKEKEFLEHLNKQDILHQKYLDEIERLEENIKNLERKLNEERNKPCCNHSSSRGCLLI